MHVPHSTIKEYYPIYASQNLFTEGCVYCASSILFPPAKGYVSLRIP